MKAASPGLFEAVRASLHSGRLPDAGHSDRADRVVVLGPNAAEQLHVTRVDNQPAIYIGDRLYVVVGILSGVERQPSLLGAVIIPEGTAQQDFGLAVAGVRAGRDPRRRGERHRQPTARWRSARPTRRCSRWSPRPSPAGSAPGVQSDLNSLFLLLGGVSLLVGAIGIANVTLVSVLERVGEIGLRRSLGAARRHIAGQFLVESTTLGLVGGILGAALGTLVVVGVAASRTWTPVLEAGCRSGRPCSARWSACWPASTRRSGRPPSSPSKPSAPACNRPAPTANRGDGPRPQRGSSRPPE